MPRRKYTERHLAWMEKRYREGLSCQKIAGESHLVHRIYVHGAYVSHLLRSRGVKLRNSEEAARLMHARRAPNKMDPKLLALYLRLTRAKRQRDKVLARIERIENEILALSDCRMGPPQLGNPHE